jgi:hypothetical protein
MARLELTIDVVGLEDCKASFASMYEAAENACLDVEVGENGDGIICQGMTVVAVEMQSGCPTKLTFRPTASMILFVGWLMTKLPVRASVAWRNGWPFFYCPPYDDADYADDPTPLIPNELEPA